MLGRRKKGAPVDRQYKFRIKDGKRQIHILYAQNWRELVNKLHEHDIWFAKEIKVMDIKRFDED